MSKDLRAKTQEDDLLGILMEAVAEGRITCPECGEYIEPDCNECCCGWENPLVSNCMI